MTNNASYLIAATGAAYTLRKQANLKWQAAYRLRTKVEDLGVAADAEIVALLTQLADELEQEYRNLRAQADNLVRPHIEAPAGTDECGKCGGTGKVVFDVDRGRCWDCRGRGWVPYFDPTRSSA